MGCSIDLFAAYVPPLPLVVQVAVGTADGCAILVDLQLGKELQHLGQQSGSVQGLAWVSLLLLCQHKLHSLSVCHRKVRPFNMRTECRGVLHTMQPMDSSCLMR